MMEARGIGADHRFLVLQYTVRMIMIFIEIELTKPGIANETECGDQGTQFDAPFDNQGD